MKNLLAALQSSRHAPESMIPMMIVDFLVEAARAEGTPIWPMSLMISVRCVSAVSLVEPLKLWM